MESFEQYLKSIDGLERITPAREKELSFIIQNSSDKAEVNKAKKEFTEANLTLVISRAVKFKKSYNGPLTLMDFISEGNIALLKSVEGYNAQLFPDGVFSTYAVSIIDRYLYRSVWMNSFIKIPESHLVYLRKLRSLTNEYQEEGKELTDQIITQKLEISVSLLKRLKDGMSAKYTNSLETLTNDKGESIWADMIPDENVADPSEGISTNFLRVYLDKYLERLTPRQKRAVELRHLCSEVMTYDEISKELGVSSEQARQVYLLGMRRLRRYMLK